MSSILKQVEERIGALDQKYGRPRRPLTPPSPTPRDERRRRDVFTKLGLPTPFQAWRAWGGDNGGSYAGLLTWRTSKVIDAFLFEGVPGIRDSLIDLAAFALILADCVDELAGPHSPKAGAPR